MPGREDYDIVISAKDQTAAAFKSLRNNLGQTENAISKLTSGLIAGLSAGAFAAFVGKSVEAVAAMGRLAARVGLTTDELQGLQRAVRAGGGTLDQAEQAAHRFADALGEASKRSGPLYDFLVRNNIALRNADGSLRSTGAVLADFLGLITRIQDPAKRMNVLIDVLGKESAPAMASAFKDTTQSLAGYIEKVKEAGGFTKEQIDANAKLKKDFDDLTEFFRDRALKMGIGVGKIFQGVAKSFEAIFSDKALIQQLTEQIEKLQQKQLEIAESARGGTKGGKSEIAAITDEINILLAQLNKLQGTRPRITVTRGGPQPMDILGDRKVEVGNTMADRAARTLADLDLERQKVLAIGAARRDIEIREEQIKALRQGGFSDLEIEKNLIGEVGDKIKQKVSALEKLRDTQKNLNDAFSMIGNTMVDAFDGLISRTKTWQDVLTDATRMLGKAMMQALILGEGGLAGLLGTKGSGFMSLLSQLFLPARASGGPVSAGRAYMVGEHGPEPFVPDRDGTIIPHGAMGGRKTVVNVISPPGTQVSGQRERSDGDTDFTEIILTAVEEGESRGRFDNIRRARTGVAPMTTKR